MPAPGRFPGLRSHLLYSTFLPLSDIVTIKDRTHLHYRLKTNPADVSPTKPGRLWVDVGAFCNIRRAALEEQQWICGECVDLCSYETTV